LHGGGVLCVISAIHQDSAWLAGLWFGIARIK
jgi:hypothetical protein